MSTIYLNIGSNKGDRKAHIERAVALIMCAFPDTVLRRTPYIISEPWGYESENAYLNLGIALDVLEAPDPYDVLAVTQRTERAISTGAHRNPDGTYRDREIDIDIIAIDDVRLESDTLTLPHPRAAFREFVVRPLVLLGYNLELLC